MDPLEKLIRAKNPVPRDDEQSSLVVFDVLENSSKERIFASTVRQHRTPRRVQLIAGAAAAVLIGGITLGAIFTQPAHRLDPAPAQSSSEPTPVTSTSTSTPTPEFSTYTTKSGLFSFQLPRGYTVTEAPLSDPSGGANAATIAIKNSQGTIVGHLMENFSGDGTSGPPPEQQVLDQASAPNLNFSPGRSVEYYLSFNMYHQASEVTMRLEDRSKGFYGPGPSQFAVAGARQATFLISVNEILGLYLTVDEVTAWQKTPEYATLKTMLLSLTRNQ